MVWANVAHAVGAMSAALFLVWAFAFFLNPTKVQIFILGVMLGWIAGTYVLVVTEMRFWYYDWSDEG